MKFHLGLVMLLLTALPVGVVSLGQAATATLGSILTTVGVKSGFENLISRAKPNRQDGSAGTEKNANSSLNDRQAKSLERFKKKLPADAGPTKVRDLPNGGKAFQADVPAKNVPNSYARYEKQVDAIGNTIQYTKTTYGPDGSIIHVKDKIAEAVFFP